MSRRHFCAASALAVLISCGGSSSPGTPTNPGPSQPQTRSIGGRITDAVTGAGVAGASVTVGSAAAVTTGADGSWRLDLSAPTAAPIDRFATRITAGGFHARETYVAWTNNARTDVAFDMFPDRAPFSLDFYRQLVRNRFESTTLEPLRRWTTHPNIYLHTLNPKTGQPLAPGEVDTLLQNVRDAISQLTDGRLAAGTIESGVAARNERVGTINIEIEYDPEGENCGIAFVGANPGTVTFNYGRCASACDGLPLGPELIAHEIGHALGFWHVDEGVMQALDFVNCPTVNFTQRERLHGGAAYRRPSGNLDVDKDPQTFSAITAPGAAPMIRCRKMARR